MKREAVGQCFNVDEKPAEFEVVDDTKAKCTYNCNCEYGKEFTSGALLVKAAGSRSTGGSCPSEAYLTCPGGKIEWSEIGSDEEGETRGSGVCRQVTRCLRNMSRLVHPSF